MRLSEALAQNAAGFRAGQKGVTVVTENGQFVPLDSLRLMAGDRTKPLGPIQAFMRSAWTAAAVLELVAGADLPWLVWKRNPGEQEKYSRVLGDHRESLLAAPGGPGGEMTGKALMTQTIFHQLLYGIAMWRWVRSSGETSRVRVLDPELCKIVTKKGTRPAVMGTLMVGDALGYALAQRDYSEVIGYEDENGQRLEIGEVVRIQGPNPFGSGGLSSLAYLGIASAADFAAALFNLKSLTEEGAMRGAFTDPALDSVQKIQQFKAHMRAQYADGDRWLALGAGSGYIRMSDTAKDMEWLSGVEMAASQVCAVLRVPVSLLLPRLQSLGGGSTQEAAEAALWRRGILPLLKDIRGALNNRLLTAKEAKTLWINYDSTQVEALQTGLKEKADIFEKLVRNGVTTNAAINLLELGCGPQPGGDLARYPSTLSPFDETPPEQGRKLPPPADAKL